MAAARFVDDAGLSFNAGNGLQNKFAGERLIAGRKRILSDEQDDRNYAAPRSAVTVINPNRHLEPTPGDVDGFRGIMALQENAARASGQKFKVSNPLTALSRASLAGGSVRPRETAMPPQARASVPMDDVDAAAQTGSGAAVALARKRQELGLAALDSALMRQRLADQDPDGSQAATVALGRKRHATEWDENYGDPRAQTAQNSLDALAGNAKRDEWQKNWTTQAPQRRFEAEQTERRYINPALIRQDTGLGVAQVNADGRRDVAETNAGAKMDSAQMAALARAVQEMFKQGQPGEARAYGESGGVLPESTLAQELSRMQEERPGLTPEQYIYMLGDQLTPEELSEARRLLGGA